MKTIKLGTNKRLNPKHYFLTAMTAKQKEELFSIKTLYREDVLGGNTLDYNKALRKLGVKWNISCEGILKIGECEGIQYSALYSHIKPFKGRDIEGKGIVGANREIHYRDYSKSLDEQKKLSWVVNVFPDVRMSAVSAVKQMNEQFCILWETDNSSPYVKLFTSDICFLNL